MEGTDESHQGKRKRVVTACDTCRKSKIKCDGEVPQCSRCARVKIDCVYTPVPTRKSVPAKRTKLIEGLEDRLNRIESFVMSDLVSESLDTNAKGRQNSTPSTHELNGKSIASTRSYPARPSATLAQVKDGSSTLANGNATSRSGSSVLSPSAMGDMSTDLLTTDAQGQSQYIGSASGFSIFSPKGIAWISDKVGDAQFVSVIMAAKCDEDQAWHQPEKFGAISSKRLHRRLPSKDETRALLNQPFRSCELISSLYHEATFMALFESRFSQEYDEAHGPGWWASLNMLLAVAHRVRVMGDLTLQDDEDVSWLYFKNAMSVLSDLMLRTPHILSVQALLAMALFTQGAPCAELSCFLGSAAVRLSQNMGMHKESSAGGLSPHESQERRRVFWIGYILDKNISLRYGRPPDQDDDDMDVQPPGDRLFDGTTAASGTSSGFSDLFRAMCMLAKIEGKVYKRLYSVKASRQSVGEIVNTVDQLDQELGDWRQSVPGKFRPESEIRLSNDILRLQVVDFHLAYYHCLAAIHRRLVQYGHWVSQPSPLTEDADKEKIRKHVVSSAVLCVSAARASINLIRFIPQGNLACIWRMLCYTVTSFLALCANIYQNPEDPKASLDLKLMKIVINFFSLLKNDETAAPAHHLLQVCNEFERLARRAVNQAQGKQHIDLEHNQTSSSCSANDNNATPASISGTAQTSYFLADPEASKSHENPPSDGMPTRSNASSAFQAPELLTQRQNSLLFDAGNANASQPVGTGLEEMDFTNSNISPELTMGGSSSDFWQLPMPLEWNWADMNANYFPVD